ncbi:MAG: hypothetical protein JXN62_13860 [Bacteroidales bacterium]|nr:hypothetical protein [Bacteroidales bacterium]
MKILSSLFVTGLAIAALVSCQKEDTTLEDALPVVEQETIVEEILLDLDAIADEAINLKLNEGKSAVTEGDFYLGSCSVITIDNTSDPKVITIDFGTGCTGKDGKVRSGKIIITSTSFVNATSERIKTFEDFYVDGRKVEGVVNKTITISREDHSKVAEILEDITITSPEEGGTAHRVASLIREYQFNLLGLLWDNIVSSYGTVEFTRANGLKVTKTISESDPLVFKVSCHRIVSGVVTIITSDNRTWTVDYGDGRCDNLATITSGDKTRIIRLR